MILDTNKKISYALLIFLRCIFFTIFIYLLDYLIDFGTKPLILSIGSAFGILFSSKLAFTKLNNKGFIVALTLLFFTTQFLFYICNLIPLPEQVGILSVYNIIQHLELILIFFIIGSLSTWTFWKFRIGLTIEILILSISFVYLLSSHRNYRFDLLHVLNDMSWNLGVSPLSMLVTIGVIIFTTIISYLILASLSGLVPIPKSEYKFEPNRKNTINSILILTVIALGTYFIATTTFKISS